MRIKTSVLIHLSEGQLQIALYQLISNLIHCINSNHAKPASLPLHDLHHFYHLTRLTLLK